MSVKGESSGLLSPWLLAVTPAMLCMVPCIAPLLSLRHTFIYHQDGSASRILAAALLNLLVPWLLFVGLFRAAERPGRLRLVLWTTFLSILPWVLLRTYALLAAWHLSMPLSRLVLGSCLLVLISLLLPWRPVLIRYFDRVHEIAVVLLAFFSISWVITLGQMAFCAWQTRDLNVYQRRSAAPLFKPASVTGHHGPRVVWILLDELAYDQVFGHRLPGLRLHAFDQLAGEATVFSQAVSPGIYTEEVIPQLLNGHAADGVTFTVRGELLFRSSETERWRRFQPADSVFEDALHNGYRTALAGWHNPYCRILNPVLDQCFWSSRMDSVTPEFDGDASFVDNLLGPSRRLLDVIGDLPSEQDVARTDAARYGSLHIQDAFALFAATDRLLANPSLDFIFLHIPVPHPGGIYDRNRGQITNRGTSSYADNLTLADRYLAHVRAMLEERHEWDGATVIVMGDHSWRTQLLWKGSRDWTAEDEIASHGGAFDPRPAFLVKLPQQHAAAIVDAPFPTVRSRNLLDAVMAGHIRTAADLQSWVSKPRLTGF